MTSTQQSLLALLRLALTDEGADGGVPADGAWRLTDGAWQELLTLAQRQGVICVAFEGIRRLRERGVHVPRSIVLRAYAASDAVQRAMQQRVATCQAFAQQMQGVDLYVLKGLDYAQRWPDPHWREFGDLDCYALPAGTGMDISPASSAAEGFPVKETPASSAAEGFPVKETPASSAAEGLNPVLSEAQFQAYSTRHEAAFAKVNALAAQAGAHVEDGGYKHSHVHFHGLMVENHRYLTSFEGHPAGRRRERALQQMLYEGHLNAVQTPHKAAANGRLRSPSADFTAVFLLLHAQRHFSQKGILLRHILDWFFFIRRDAAAVHWPAVAEQLRAAGLWPFAVLLTRFCTDHWGLRIPVPEAAAALSGKAIPLSDKDGSHLSPAAAHPDKDVVLSDKLLRRFADDVMQQTADEAQRNVWQRLAGIGPRLRRQMQFRAVLTQSPLRAMWYTIGINRGLIRPKW